MVAIRVAVGATMLVILAGCVVTSDPSDEESGAAHGVGRMPVRHRASREICSHDRPPGDSSS